MLQRTALEISAAIEAVGGEMNAFTGKGYTCYYARALDEELPLAIDVMTDLSPTRGSKPPMSTEAAPSSKRSRRTTTSRVTRCTTSSSGPSTVTHPLGRLIFGTEETSRR